jgi:CubicO group peptidase (beta-lactamase class C family)
MFQDWSRSQFRMTGNMDVSEHLACSISLSTRDMARIGEMMLRRGQWKGLKIVPESWVVESTRQISKFAQGGGYGYMWWVENEDQQPPVYKGAFSARGMNSQRITVIPELDMVIVHHVADASRRMKSADYRKLVYLVVTSKL